MYFFVISTGVEGEMERSRRIKERRIKGTFYFMGHFPGKNPVFDCFKGEIL
jgi:hypothetical protein